MAIYPGIWSHLLTFYEPVMPDQWHNRLSFTYALVKTSVLQHELWAQDSHFQFWASFLYQGTYSLDFCSNINKHFMFIYIWSESLYKGTSMEEIWTKVRNWGYSNFKYNEGKNGRKWNAEWITSCHRYAWVLYVWTEMEEHTIKCGSHACTWIQLSLHCSNLWPAK